MEHAKTIAILASCYFITKFHETVWYLYKNNQYFAKGLMGIHEIFTQTNMFVTIRVLSKIVVVIANNVRILFIYQFQTIAEYRLEDLQMGRTSGHQVSGL